MDEQILSAGGFGTVDNTGAEVGGTIVGLDELETGVGDTVVGVGSIDAGVVGHGLTGKSEHECMCYDAGVSLVLQKRQSPSMQPMLSVPSSVAHVSSVTSEMPCCMSPIDTVFLHPGAATGPVKAGAGVVVTLELDAVVAGAGFEVCTAGRGWKLFVCSVSLVLQ